MSRQYFINLSCALLSIAFGVSMIYFGAHFGEKDMLFGGIFMTVVMSCFTLYIFGVSDQKKESNRLRYLAWRRGPRRGAKIFGGIVVFLVVCTILHVILQSLQSKGLFR